jgi:methylated-DNA-protein-cysteine methyltransferase-like protein
MLTGKHHFATPETMRELLENEGLTVINDQIVNFSEVFWNPLKEPGIEKKEF